MRTPSLAFLFVLAGLVPLGAAAGEGAGYEGVGLAPGSGGHHGIGPHYQVHFDTAGVRFEPALGRVAPTLQFVRFGEPSVGRDGADLPRVSRSLRTAVGERVEYDLGGGGIERWQLEERGVEFSYLVPERPAGSGDLIVRLPLATSLPDPEPDGAGGLRFVSPDFGGVSIGAVTGIDALGRTQAGELRWAEGVLELRLAADFVDSATYPLLVDPLVGPILTPSTGNFDEVRADVAGFQFTGFLAVWQRVFSADSIGIRVRRLGLDGVPAVSSPVLALGSAGAAENPRVASLGGGHYGVVWQERVPGTFGTSYRIRMQSVNVDTGVLGNVLTVASTTDEVLGDPVVAGEWSDSPLFRFLVVWRDEGLPGIRYARVQSGPTGTLSLVGTPAVLATNGALTGTYGQFAVPRRSTSSGHVLVVVRRTLLVGFPASIQVTAVPLGSGTATAFTSLPSSTADRRFPALDGNGLDFVLGYEHQLSGGRTNIAARTVRFQPANQTFGFGAEQLLTDYSLSDARLPAVAYRPGKTFVGWVQSNVFSAGTNSFVLRSLNSTNCAPCQNFGTIASGDASAETRIQVASTSTATGVDNEMGLVVMSRSDGGDGEIWGQSVSFGTGSNVTPLGGGCGGGNTDVQGSTAIGSTTLRILLNGSPGSQTVALLNLAQPTSLPLACGPCVIQPLEIYFAKPVLLGRANLSLTVPCLPGLDGTAIDAQWATYTPGAGACSTIADWAFSSRSRIHFGF